MTRRDSLNLTDPLTRREAKVAGLVAEGMTNRDVSNAYALK